MIRLTRTRTLRALRAAVAEAEADVAAYVMECADWQKQFVRVDRRVGEAEASAEVLRDDVDAARDRAEELQIEADMLRESLRGAIEAEESATKQLATLEAEATRLRQELKEATALTRGARWFYVMCHAGRPMSIHSTRQEGRTAAEDSGAPGDAWTERPAATPLTPRGWDIVAVPLPPVQTEGEA
ncbi:hypothetical protein [Streptomyces sp. NPDC053048]|uniref:hypothetical protein n=1 Tax=Streptomyces sp. NPDC053048 TaxID=3365694 RepID=UPI0037CF426B